MPQPLREPNVPARSPRPFGLRPLYSAAMTSGLCCRICSIRSTGGSLSKSTWSNRPRPAAPSQRSGIVQAAQQWRRSQCDPPPFRNLQEKQRPRDILEEAIPYSRRSVARREERDPGSSRSDSLERFSLRGGRKTSQRQEWAAFAAFSDFESVGSGSGLTLSRISKSPRSSAGPDGLPFWKGLVGDK